MESKSPNKNKNNLKRTASKSDMDDNEQGGSKDDVVTPKDKKTKLNEENNDNNVTKESDLIKQTGFVLNCECDNDELKQIKSTEKHKILFETNSENNNVDEWNTNYVRMPHSNQNLDAGNKKQWPLIEKTLEQLAKVLTGDQDSIYIENAIKKYNQTYKNKWNFEALHFLFNKEYKKTKQDEIILKDLIPKIIKLALDLPNQIKCAIPLLKSSMNYSLTFTQEQCACLLANAFFCTFPMRNYYEQDKNEYNSFPFINFNDLFSLDKKSKKKHERKIEKLKCILHYFKRITDSMPSGFITFSRRSIDLEKFPNFSLSNTQVRDVVIRYDGVIEDCEGALQVDFANKFIGGGVLNSGCVQEEIRFVLCPEALVSLLFCEKLEYNECIIIKGIERFSNYTGYGDTFEWNGDYKDSTPFDKCNRRQTKLLAIDALNFRYAKNQFEERQVLRELRKSYCGFSTHTNSHTCSAIATGNWGCGAFNGDVQLKFIIQLISASENQRDMIYYTFKNGRVASELSKIYDLIKKNKLTCGELYNYLIEYSAVLKSISDRKSKNQPTLYEFLNDRF